MNYNNIVKFYQNIHEKHKDQFILIDKDDVYYYKQKDHDWEVESSRTCFNWSNLKEITKAEFFITQL